jgi:ABC-type phosphate transport system permease subunit
MLVVILVYGLAIGVNGTIWLWEFSHYRWLTGTLDIGISALMFILGGSGPTTAAAALIGSLFISAALNIWLPIPDVYMLVNKYRKRRSK